ncbi:MAG: glycosyltransferase family 39 protein [Candidatus Nanopelagicales bacterium]
MTTSDVRTATELPAAPPPDPATRVAAPDPGPVSYVEAFPEFVTGPLPPAPEPAAPPAEQGPGRDPRWTRIALVVLLVGTGLLYLWDLGSSGWANAYYSAAVQAASESWKAFFFGSFDASNLITVDKPPASLWPMALSARVFGVNAWSILVPQALMGVASVWLLYATVRRWHGAVAGLIAGAALALTPVAALMFRFNNPDALLVLLMTAAAYTTVRAVDRGSLRWIAGTGVLIGFAFLAKSLQAFLVVPALALVWFVAARTGIGRRVVGLLVGGVAIVLSAGWWVAIVELWPADSRPYIGGSQTNSVLELVLGYNGLGRLTGEEVGSVTPGGGGPGGSIWGETGITRLFSDSYGGQAAWLIPAALVLMVALVVVAGRGARTDRLRASALLWGGWLLVTAAVISFSQGIIHEYYTVALAPAIGALVGAGGVELWRRRSSWAARATLAATVAVTAVWAYALLSRSPDWLPWLRVVVLAGGLAVAVLLLGAHRYATRAAAGIAAGAVVVALAGPAAASVQTALTPHTGSLPLAGPTVTSTGPGGRGGPGGAPGGFPGAPGGQAGPAFPAGPGGQLPGGPGGQLPGGPGGQLPGAPGGTAPGGGGAAGGLLDASTPGEDLVALLESDADAYTWVAAAVGSQSAAGYQLATGLPVMSLGGFNGSDPAPTLEQFQQYVADGDVHYFVAGGGGPGGGGPGGFGGQNGGSSATSQISAWVSANFAAQTVDGVTVYDLTTPSAG